MQPSQRDYFFNVAPPAAIVDNAAVTCNVIDTLGYDRCDVFYIFGATDIATVSMGCTESDTKANTTTLTSGAAISGLTVGTATNIAGSTSALPTSTADNTCYKFEIKCGGPRKRYLLPAITCGDGAAGTYVTVVALLSKGEISADTATARNYNDILRV